MRRNKRTFLATPLIFTLALVIGPAAALAFPAHGGKGFGHPGGAVQMLREHQADLDLTDEQLERLEALQVKQRESMRDQRESFRAQRRALRELLQADQLDRTEAERRIDTIVNQMAKVHRARMSAMLDAREILTPTQRQKLRELRRAKREACKTKCGEAAPVP
jgi:Spy/CpxP family protein refolding chaperone